MAIELNEYRLLNESFKDKLVFRVGDSSGFFSEYNNMILAIHYCLINKIQFILNSKSANFSIKNGWTELFKPFCHEYNFYLLTKYNSRCKPPYENIADRYIYNAYKRVNRINYFTYNLFKSIREASVLDSYNIPELNLNGSLLDNCIELHKMIWRYQPEIEESIFRIRNSIQLNEPYVGFHIRSGDKFIESDLIDVHEYVNKSSQYTELRKAFVLTDDYRVFRELESKYSDWKFYTLCAESEMGYFHQEFLKKSKYEQRSKLLKLFASMDVLESADLFIGTYSSNPGMNMGFRIDKSKIYCLDFNEWLIW